MRLPWGDWQVVESTGAPAEMDRDRAVLVLFRRDVVERVGVLVVFLYIAVLVIDTAL